ncbi:MAG: hypothetical protein JRI76_07895 [Deltaproteobacteria bacterium]|nr:hypothetical protein [Deltaproteobacteria bacterium]MBW2041940.1 hypothetical protein [Deltaproteobacteria bacterium]
MATHKRKSVDNRYRILFAATLALGIGLAGYQFFSKTAWVTVELQCNALTNFKVYWAGHGQVYSEHQMGSIRINPVQKHYHFLIGNLETIRKIRIDPSDSHQGRAKVRIRSILIYQPGYVPIRFASQDDFRQIRPVSGISSFHVDSSGLLTTAIDNDPQLETDLFPVFGEKRIGVWTMIGVGTFFLILFFSWLGAGGEDFDYVPGLLFFVAALVMLMAVFSQENAHPDEYVHIAAARYYENKVFPPAVCTPGTEHTYSVYGVSRLTSREIVYPLAGKFSRLLSVFPFDPHVRLRLFNATLFVMICTFCLRYPDARILGAVFLLSPQIWYVFSYFNSDAFALFLIFVIGYQFLGRETLFQRYMKNPWNKRTLLWGIGIGITFSGLVFIKKNFYIFPGFLAMYLVWCHYFQRERFGAPRAILEKLSILLMVVIVAFAAWLALDYGVNGLQKQEQLLECREKLAHTPYKPSTPLDKKHPWMKLKKRGVSLSEMFTGYRWGSRSFKSAFGVYGYTTIAGPEGYYAVVKTLALGFFAFLFGAAFLKPRWENGLLFLIVLFSSIVLLEAALWRAWTVMLQPQGRYLFPIGVMAGFYLHRFRGHPLRIGLNAFILAFFVLSVISFIFVGMVNIPH